MILGKTAVGHQVFKERSVRLSARQRSAFILFNGKRSVAQVSDMTEGLSLRDVEDMLQQGLLIELTEAAAASAAPPLVAPAAIATAPLPLLPVAIEPEPVRRPSVPLGPARFEANHAMAQALTAPLGLRCARLNTAVQAARTHEELMALAPKIRAAVGGDRSAALEAALAL